jgi:hypothetical protein
MRKVKAKEAIGMALGHDLTRIVPGTFKGAIFKRGHIIQEEDIPALLDTGNEYIYVLELREGELHEDEAGTRLAEAIAGPGIECSPPEEGKVSMRARWKGLLRIDVTLLEMINSMNDIIVATLHDHTPCKEGTIVAATRVIPLTISEKIIEEVEGKCKDKTVVNVFPYQLKKVGVVVTGDEVFHGRIKNSFDEMVGVKIRGFGATIVGTFVVPDDPGHIARSLLALKDKGAEILLTTGGLSVDPGDVTKKGVEETGAEVISYGSPILPGAMFLYAILDGIPLLGLPACVFYHPTTIFDLIFPRVVVGEHITRKDLVSMGHGGLCLGCEVCRFPHCPFGKG